MKPLLPVLLFLASGTLRAQSEFASRGFYEDFRKIWSDARLGFTQERGILRDSTETMAVYRPRHLPALADSGVIVIPAKGHPYAEYFFEPAKNRLKTDQRGTDLRDAIVMAMGQPLYCRTETFMVEERPHTHTWIFADPAELRPSVAPFRISIYYNEGLYCLSLIVRGASPE